MEHNHTGSHEETEGFVNLPTPTIWPFILAFGISLAITGLVTHWVITLLGICLIVPAVVGWFSQVLPHEQHEPVAVSTEVITLSSDRIASVHHAVAQGRREVEPLESYSVWVGVKGGLAGGVAMTIPAGIFGLVQYHSPWYAINLLAAGGFVSWATESDAFPCPVPYAGPACRIGNSYLYFRAGGASLRGDAAHVPQKANHNLRLYRTVSLDWNSLYVARRAQPDP